MHVHMHTHACTHGRTPAFPKTSLHPTRCRVHAAARAKEALRQRLEVTEERLKHLCSGQPMQDLVEAKLRLAQADFHTLELQV